MTLAHRLVKRSISEFASSVDIRTTSDQGLKLLDTPTDSCHVYRAVSEVASLINMLKSEFGKLRQVLVLISLQYFRRGQLHESVSDYLQLHFIHSSRFLMP